MSEIVFNSLTPEASLQSQVSSFQTTLASLNQQIIVLQEALQEKDQEIADLKAALAKYNQDTLSSDDIPFSQAPLKTGGNLTIIGILINLFRFIFWPRKENTN